MSGAICSGGGRPVFAYCTVDEENRVPAAEAKVLLGRNPSLSTGVGLGATYVSVCTKQTKTCSAQCHPASVSLQELQQRVERDATTCAYIA